MLKKPPICPGVQVHAQHPARSGGGDQVGHQLGGDGHPGGHLAVLAGVAVVGDHRGDAPGAAAPKGVEHDKKLHQVVVHRRAGGLHHEHVRAAHVFTHLHEDLAVAKAAHHRLGQGQVQIVTDLLHQVGVAVAGEHLELIEHGSLKFPGPQGPCSRRPAAEIATTGTTHPRLSGFAARPGLCLI